MSTNKSPTYAPGEEITSDSFIGLMKQPTQLTQQEEPADKLLIYTYHNSTGPIKSVYDHETEAKANGLIKEMTFVAPINHDINPATTGPKKPPANSPRMKLARKQAAANSIHWMT